MNEALIGLMVVWYCLSSLALWDLNARVKALEAEKEQL